jgi:hypothetical protein
LPRFPVAFPPPAFRFSVILFPPRIWALLTVGLPDPSPEPDRVPVFRTRCSRSGCPLYPEDGGAPPGQVVSLTGACRSSAASPSIPATSNPSTRVPSRGINEGSSDSPVRLSPRLWRPGGTGRLGLSPGLRTPPTRSRRRTPRWGQAIRARTWNYSLNIYIGLILQSVVHSQRATSRRTTTWESALTTAGACSAR